MPVVMKQVYGYDQNKTRQWPVPVGTVAGTAVIAPAGDQVGVAITSPGGSTVTKSGLKGSVTSMTIENGGVGNASGHATVATDGSWIGPVTGASDSTPRGTLVYAVVDAGVITSLTLTASTNKKFGVVDQALGRASADGTVVKIGVFA